MSSGGHRICGQGRRGAPTGGAPDQARRSGVLERFPSDRNRSL